MHRIVPLVLLAAMRAAAAVASIEPPYLVRDIDTARAAARPTYLTEAAGTIFFFAHEPDGSAQLWKSDGTSGGPVRIADVPSPTEARGVGGTLFFAAANADGTTALWRSDGTLGGTIPLAAFAWPAPRHL